MVRGGAFAAGWPSARFGRGRTRPPAAVSAALVQDRADPDLRTTASDETRIAAPFLTGSPEMLRGGAGAADAQDVVAGPLLVEMCTSHSRGAFCTRERRLELHSRVRSERLGAQGVGGAGPASRSGRPPCSPWSPAGPRRPRQTFSRARGGAVCPNLPQRPGSSRNAGGESLVFRASSRRRSRSGAPLQQIWTRRRSRSSQKPHTHHPAPPVPVTAPIRAHGPPIPARKAHYSGEKGSVNLSHRRRCGGGVEAGKAARCGPPGKEPLEVTPTGRVPRPPGARRRTRPGS